jgi:hypothetical protein
MFSQRAHACLLVFVFCGEQSIRIKQEFARFWTVNLNYTVLKFPSLAQIYIFKNQMRYYVVATANIKEREGRMYPDCVDSLRAVPSDLTMTQ